MSSIIFEALDGGQEPVEARISGSERAYMGILIEGLAASVIPEFPTDDQMRHVAADWQYKSALRRLANGWRGDQFLGPDGARLSTSALVGNTVMVLGSEPVRLMARLHLQCELHAYVEGYHRAWLSGIIQAGLDSGLYRPSAGWPDLIEFLCTPGEHGPVVTSYSVSDCFLDDYGRSDDEGLGDDLWLTAISRLREANKTDELELTPESLKTTYRFGPGLSFLDLFVNPERVPA